MTPKKDSDEEKRQLAWLKYRDDNEACFDSDEEAVYCTWTEGYDAGRESMRAEVEALKAEIDKLKANTPEAADEALNAATKTLGW